jgi:hypothetical protein
VTFGPIIAIMKNRDMARRAIQSVGMTEFTDWRPHAMQGKVKEDWMLVCEQVAIEQNPERMMALLRELNRMLDEKEERLKREHAARGGI